MSEKTKEIKLKITGTDVDDVYLIRGATSVMKDYFGKFFDVRGARVTSREAGEFTVVVQLAPLTKAVDVETEQAKNDEVVVKYTEKGDMTPK